MNTGNNSMSKYEDVNEANVIISKINLVNIKQKRFQIESHFKQLEKQERNLNRYMNLRGGKSPTDAPCVAPPTFTLDDMLKFSSDQIPSSILKLNSENTCKAIKMFANMKKFVSTEDLTQKIDVASKILQIGHKRMDLRDEMFMQLVKQTRGNPDLDLRLKYWKLFRIVAATMPPSKEFAGLVSDHITNTFRNNSEETYTVKMARKTWDSLKRSALSGSRKELPTEEEIGAFLENKHLQCDIFLLNGSKEQIEYDISTTVFEAVEQISSLLKLKNFNTFTLFDCQKTLGAAVSYFGDIHLVLDDSKYIGDILINFSNSKGNLSHKLILKKRMFLASEETVKEPSFQKLHYIQTQYDYMSGNYPVHIDEAVHLAAMQMKVDRIAQGDVENVLTSYVPREILLKRDQDDWILRIKDLFKKLELKSKEEIQDNFVSAIQNLPYGNCVFYATRKLEDPIGLLPSRVLLAVNKRGLHFFKPLPRCFLRSVALRDIMQFGASSVAVFFKMKVSGILHTFQLETTQGEEICLALQTHINDLLKSQDPQAKKEEEVTMVEEEKKTKQYELPLNGNNVHKKLEERDADIEALEKKTDELNSKNDKIKDELVNTKHMLEEEVKAKKETLTTKVDLDKQKEIYLTKIYKIRAELGMKESYDVNMDNGMIVSDHDPSRIIELEAVLEKKEKELKSLEENLFDLNREYNKANDEKNSIRQKLINLERNKNSEKKELKHAIYVTKENFKLKMKEVETKINNLMEDTIKKSRAYDDSKAKLIKVRQDMIELAELREMVADVDRRQFQQNHIIENQSKRLEDLEILHKDEQILRKRYMSSVDEMLGKIRVMARVCPSEYCSDPILEYSDEFTLKKRVAEKFSITEEFAYEQVFHQQHTNNNVYNGSKVVLNRAFEGYNVNLVSCGVEGSGKSHSLFGNHEDIGIVYRTMSDFCEEAKKRKKWTTTFKTWMLQITNDKLVDLLQPTKEKEKKLVIKKDMSGLVHVINKTEVGVNSELHFMDIVHEGLMKHASSSSGGKDLSKTHLMIGINVTCTNVDTGSITRGRVIFYDLSGFNKNVTDNNNMEAIVSALKDENEIVPYTACTLTKLMSDCFGGNAKAIVLAHVSPEESQWTKSKEVLEFASKVSMIQNETVKIEHCKETQKLIRQLNHLKEQAKIPPHLFEAVDMIDIINKRDDPIMLDP